MKSVFLCGGLLFAAASVAEAQTYHPTFDPAALNDRPVGDANEVMVLGTPHLSQLPDGFRLEMVEPLVDRLVQWGPTAVATEDNSGLLCDKMRRMADRYAEAIDSYCFDPTLAGSATGLTVPAANAKAEAMLVNWPEDPAPEMRRELAAAFLAAGEPGSAVVQWLRLPRAEQVTDEVLTEQLVALLVDRAGRKNETYSIAARVAARSGLERLWSVDDQSTFMGPAPDRDAYGSAIMAAWDNPATRMQAVEADALVSGLDQPDGLLTMYRAYNSPAYAEVKYQSDFGAALKEPSAEGYGRRYVTYWETRNLRMVANIREVLGRRPGTRMLTIVGASHKGYYEAYLELMRDVQLIDVTSVLQKDIQ